MQDNITTEYESAWVAPDRRRGRGARSNASGRHEAMQAVGFDDGWDVPEEAARLRTEVTVERARTILARNTSPDIPFDRSINPYRGCEHGCIYCYARPSHANMGLSPGLDFESRLFVKPDAAALLRKELRRPGYRCKPVALGSNTDPYQPIERDWRIMRGILEVLEEARHPVTIVTKSANVLRDLDILQRMAQRNLVKVALSVTTLDHRLARRLEPRASTPGRRLEAVAKLSDAGVPVGVMVAPVIPGLTDHEIEAILKAAAEAGAVEAGWILLRLPLEIRELFAEWLAEETPDRAKRVMTLLSDMRGGRANDPRFGHRLRGEGQYAEMLADRFRATARRLGLNADPPSLDCTQFHAPAADPAQGSLF